MQSRSYYVTMLLLHIKKNISDQHASIEALSKVTLAKELDDQLAQCGTELEMLIEVVSNLKIDDANSENSDY